VRVPQYVVECTQEISVERIETEANAKIRRIMTERYRHGEEINGGAGHIRDAGGERLDHDERFGTLWRRNLPDDEPIVMLEMAHRTPEPDGHFKHYWLRVPPTTQTAHEAVAWTLDVPTEDYAPTIEACPAYLPRRALDAITDMEGVAHIDHFDHNPATGVRDATIATLGMSLLPAFERPDEASHLFVDHVTCAATIHILRAYGAGQAARRHLGNRLAPWQLKRAKDVLMADLAADVSVAQLAAACGLSISAFTKGFALSTGLPPHKWLLEQRVQRSMCLLREGNVPFDEIAKACGFFDPHHFIRVFARMVGTHPRAWQHAVKH
jgi:AraC-like DNA-binding protein